MDVSSGDVDHGGVLFWRLLWSLAKLLEVSSSNSRVSIAFVGSEYLFWIYSPNRSIKCLKNICSLSSFMFYLMEALGISFSGGNNRCNNEKKKSENNSSSYSISSVDLKKYMPNSAKKLLQIYKLLCHVHSK